MSGICGIIRFDGRSIKEKEIANMLNAIPHRGNDFKNTYINGNVGFGHTMLYTSNESLYEIQPLKNINESLILTADARIDNRDELIYELEIKESTLDIITDTDLILFAYEKWGEESPKYLIGDFAYVIWDAKKNHLFCARDRIGIKPFYYFLDKDKFVFASEIPAIFAIEGIEREINIDELKCYMENIFPENTDTYFKNIFRLPAASHMTVLDNQTSASFSSYWDLNNIEINWNMSLEDVKVEFLKLFTQAIECRMRSVYPIGLDLSGGLDSSSIVCMADRLNIDQTITSFSIRYGSKLCDEGEYINEVSQSIKNEVIGIDVTEKGILEKYGLDFIHEHNSEWPVFGTYSDAFPLAVFASEQNVRIMLSGVGGDDILTGNLHYLTDYLRHHKYVKLYKALRNLHFNRNIIIDYLIRPILPPYVKSFLKSILRRNNKEIIDCKRLKNLDNLEAVRENNSEYRDDEIKKLRGPVYTMWFEDNPTKIVGLYNIEVSFPFFDSRLIEFVMTLPPELKSKSNQYVDQKIILREAMKGILPEKIRTRSNKAEFTDSIQFQLEQIKDIDVMFNNSLILEKKLITQQELDKLLLDFNKQSDDFETINKLWEVINLELFLEKNNY